MAFLQSLRVGIYLLVTLLFMAKDCRSFFLRHSQTGKCIIRGRNIVNDAWTKFDYAELGNDCLDKKAQFRYQYKEILSNIDTMGALVALTDTANYTEKFLIVSLKNGSKSLWLRNLYNLKQTMHGSLYAYRQGFCANFSDSEIFLDRVRTCDQPEQRFTFGSVTNFTDQMKDVHCSPAQRIAIVKAEYGTFRTGDAFSDDKNDIDAVCSSFASRAVKDKCDGNRSCNLTVDRSLLDYKFCPDTTKEIYLEYNCVDINQTVITIVKNIRLSELPNEGFIEIYDGSIWRMVNEVSWSKKQQNVLCQFFGYEDSGMVTWKKIRSGIEILSGYLYCYDNQSRDVFCSALLYRAMSTSDQMIPYLTCNVCDKPLLRDSIRFPDSIFSGLNHTSVLKEARWSNNGWCAKGTMEHLLIDLQRDYLISNIAILGDKNQTKWLENFTLVYSYRSDFWRSSSIQIIGNRNAVRASLTNLNIYNVRFLKIIPSQNKSFCLRVELCGHVQLLAPVKSVMVDLYPRSWIAWVYLKLPAKNESSRIRYLLLSINGTGRHERNVSLYWYYDHWIWPYGHWWSVLPQTYYTVRVRTGDGYTVSEAVNKTFVTSRPVTPIVRSHSWKSLVVYMETCPYWTHELKYALIVVQAASNTARPPDEYKTSDLKPYDGHPNNAYVTAGVEWRYFCFPSITIGDGKLFNISNGTFFNHPLNENTHYVVFVRYFTSESSYSTSWSSSVKTFFKPPAPVITNIVSIGDRSLNISWRQPSLPENQTVRNYYVSYRKSGMEFTNATGSTEKYYILRCVEDKDKYYITVQIETNAGRSDPSEKLPSMTDIDECQMKSLCTEGYDCVNTLGSYQCVCKGSIESDGKCTKGTIKRHRVNLRLNEDYKPQYANGTSEEFRAIETRITNAINKIYANNDNFRKVDVNELRNGSVIADLDLTFKDTDDSGVSGLLAAVRNNSFGDFEVDPDALTIVIIGTCPSDECPKNSTCKILTPSTISCPCDENFYFDGVNCAENDVIEIEITLEKPFVEALNNVSSPEYIELKRNVTAELTEVFKDTPNFQEVQVLGFRNGSTIVDFKVIYRQDRVLNNKVVVAEAIKKQLKNNKIRNLALKFGTGVKLGGTPDPPTDLKQTDVTEDRIDISWGEPVGARFFQINGYIISYKTVSESQYKMKNVSAESSVKILVLSDLESDTFYTISVHAYNDDGDGDKVTIQVTTKDTDSPVVIIVVVVIVCVLLIIVMVVIFIQLRRRRKRQHLRSPRPHPDRDVMKLTGFQAAFENKAPGDEEMSGSQAQNL